MLPSRETRVLLLAFLPLLPGCGAAADAPSGPQRADSAGVELVVNPGEDRPLAWAFEETLRLGAADEGPEAFYRLWDGRVTTGPGDRIYVVDGGNRQLKAFDDRGIHLWTAGREGEGPGEFRIPLAVTTDPDGRVSVLDLGKRSLIRLSPDGDFLEEEPLEGDLIGTGVARPAEGVRVLARRARLRDGENTERRLLERVRGADTTLLHAHHAPREEMIRVEACGTRLMLRLGPFFSPGFAWTARGETVASAWGWPDYRVDMHEGGILRRSVRRSGERPVVDAAAVRAENPDGFALGLGEGGEPCELDLDELMEKAGHAPVIPAVSDLALNPDGEIWVERGRAGDDVTDVFGPDGAYMGTLPEGSPYPVAFLADGRVVTVEEDDLGLQTVVVYRVVRDGDAPAGG